MSRHKKAFRLARGLETALALQLLHLCPVWLALLGSNPEGLRMAALR